MATRYGLISHDVKFSVVKLKAIQLCSNKFQEVSLPNPLQIFMAFIDLVLLNSLLNNKGQRGQHGPPRSSTDSTVKHPKKQVVGLFCAAMAVTQLWVYNGFGVDEDGEKRGEVPAHYLEFVFEAMSGAITVWFCLDNKTMADREVNELMWVEGACVDEYV